MLLGLGGLVGRGGAEDDCEGGSWDSGGHDGVWAHGRDGGGSDHESKDGGEEDQPQQGLEEPVVLMGLRDLMSRGGAGTGFVGGIWDSGGQDAENVWPNGGDGGGSDEHNTEGTEEDQPQQGLAANVRACARPEMHCYYYYYY